MSWFLALQQRRIAAPLLLLDGAVRRKAHRQRPLGGRHACIKHLHLYMAFSLLVPAHLEDKR